VYRELATGPIGVQVPFAEAARLAQEHGFEALSVEVDTLSALGPSQAKDILAAHGLRTGSAGMPVNFRGDEATFKEGLSAFSAQATLLQAAGCNRVLTWIMPFHETLSYAENYQQLRRRTASLCAVMADHGIRYGLEFVGPRTLRAGKPNPFIHDIPGLLELIDAVGASNLGILLDAFHWYTTGSRTADLARLTDALVVGVHVNDARAGRTADEQIDRERAMPGETGVIDIRTFLRALDGMGYTGPVIVEPFSERIRALPPQQAVAEKAASLDRIFAIAGL